MTADHDKDLGQDAQDRVNPRWRLAHWILAGALVTPLAAGGVAWLARKPIAHAALQSWCGGRSLACDARFDRIGPGRIVVSGVQVSSGSRLLFEAAAIDASLTWRGLMSPGVSVVAIDAPVLRARLEDGRVSLDGLERLVPEGGGGGTMPRIELTHGRLVLSTPAGDLDAAVNASGTYPEAGRLDIDFAPASLSGPQGSVDLGPGTASLIASEGRLTGKIGIDVKAAALSGLSLTGTTLRADLAPVSGGRSETRIDWSAALASATVGGTALTGVEASGHAELARLGGGAFDDFLAALTETRAEAVIAELTTSAYGSGPARVEADLTGNKGHITGPVTLTAEDVSAPEGAARTVTIAGDATREVTGALAFAGKASVTGAHLTPELRARLLAPLALPGMLAAHGASARRAFDRGLDAFDTAMSVEANLADGALGFAARGETTLSSASGLQLAVTPAAGAPWLSVAPGTQSFGGAVVVSGGGAPSVRARIDTLDLTAGAVVLGVRDLGLAPWTVSGLTVSADIASLGMNQADQSRRVTGAGTVILAGALAGAQLRETRLSGAIEAVSDAAGFAVRSTKGACLALATRGVTIGAIAVSAVDLDLCAAGGAFITPGSRSAAGALTLGDIRIPFSMASGGGVLGLDGAAIDWNAAKDLRLLVRADTMDLPLQIGERTLTIDGKAPRFDIRTGTGPVRLAATLGPTAFGGTLIPARVSAGAFRFTGTNARSGISGDLSSTGVLIEDFRDDPLYRPLRTDLSATIADNQLTMAGPLRARTGLSRAGEQVVADSRVEIDIIKLDGTASVRSRDLVFRRDGFQPEDLSGRLVGVFTQATGALDAKADFTIRSGQIAGTADVSVTDFGFQTTRLGRVTDVDGRVRFSDLLALTTLPGQEFTIGSVSPGVRLSGGRIVFGLENGSLLNIETVAFPFAGGVLSVEPLAWALGGGNQRIDVTASGIGLAELVETLKLPDTQATGTVGGRFPIDFEGASVFIRDARLVAEPPGGRLSYTGGGVNALADQESTARLAFEALKDFEFNVLEIALSGNTTGRMDASMRLAGVNLRPVPFNDRLTIPPGQAFEFDIAFDVPFQQILSDSLGAFDQNKLIETAIRIRREEQGEGDPADQADETE